MESMRIKANLDALEVIGDYVAAAAQQAGLDEKASYNLCLAVDEIATNIIVYGYAEAGLEGLLELWANNADRSLAITLEDTAMHYDPRTTPLPDMSLPPEERSPGGLGVYLAIRSVDDFLYEQVGNRNRHIFTMRKAQAARDD